MKISLLSKGRGSCLCANERYPFRLILKNVLRTMKVTAVLLLVACLQVSAAAYSQKISLSVRNTPMEKIFREINRQSGYLFLYSNEVLQKAKPVTLEVKDTPLEKVLQECFENQPLTYTITDKTIIVKQREKPLNKPQAMQADTLIIRGQVLGQASGEPLPGASVAVKGTSRGATTDANGRFAIAVKPDDVLLVMYLGYQPQEIAVGNNSIVKVALRPRVVAMDEVSIVSTGYQDLKKGQLTGAYSTVSRSDYLQNVPVSGNIVENMEGRIPGLVLNMNQSRNNQADPNNTSPFTIRGVSTFSAIKKPLIVLNGYPTEIDIASINPYDIESITVLKDAASAAIYGVRASNGVIVINTRKGQSGKPVFHFTTALTYSPKPDFDKLNLLSGRGFVDFESANGINDIENNFISKEYIDMTNGTYTPVFSITDDLYNGRITQAEADKLYGELAAYDNTEDYKRLFLQNQFLQTYDFNVSGGGDNSTYFLGVNHVDNRGSDKYSGYNKTNINYRGAFDFSKRISLDVQTIYSNINSKNVPIPDYMSMKPYQHFLDADGNALPTYFTPFNEAYYGFGESYGTISAARNQENMALGLYDEFYYPYQEMFENSTKSKSDIYRVQGNLKAKIVSGLNLEVGGVFEREADNTKDIASENSYATRIMLNYYASPDPITGKPVFGMPQGGVKKTTDHSINSYTLRAQLTYNKMLAEKHDIALLGGTEVRRMTNTGSLNTIFGYNDNTLSIKPANLTMLGSQTYYPGYNDVIVPIGGFVYDQTEFTTPFFDETFTDNRYLSYYGNAAYTYNHKYTITGSLRIDQSNLFGTDPKFRYTPLWSTGAAWNVSNEDFLQSASWINDLNLRVAAGYNGNIIKGSGPYNILGASINTYLPNPLVGYTIAKPRNNQLRWEKTFNFNTGIDFSVFDSRFSGSVDYYIKRGEDIFSAVQSDPTFGFSNLYTNNASIENRGVDLMLSSVNVNAGKFTWQTQLTGSFNKSEVLKVRNKWNGFYMFTRAGGAENIEGHPMNSVLTLDYAGLNDKGQPLVRDENGELVVVGYGEPDIAFGALHFAGVNNPRYVLGFNNQFSLGSFSLSALIMYYGGHVGLVAPPTVYDVRPTKEMANYWREPGDEKTTDIPGFTSYSSPDYFQSDGYQFGQKFVRKFDYIAFRDITLTYNMKNAISQKIGLRNTRLILQVQNPGKYVFSGNDVDPETFNFVSGRRGLPVVPAYTFSLSTNF